MIGPIDGYHWQIAAGLLIGITLIKYSWRLTQYFWSLSSDSGNALGGMIATGLAAFGVAIGIGIVCLSLIALIFGGSIYPVSSG